MHNDNFIKKAILLQIHRDANETELVYAQSVFWSHSHDSSLNIRNCKSQSKNGEGREDRD